MSARPEGPGFWRRFRERARRDFVTGVLIIVPLWVTWWVLSAIVRRMDRVLAILPERFHPATYLPFPVPGLGVILTLVVIQLVGTLGANLFGRALVRGVERLLARIPFVRAVHLLIKQFLEQIVSVDASRFRRVVLVRYPGEGVFRIGLVTGERTVAAPDGTERRMLHLFLPNSPNAATGLFFVAEEDQVVPTDLTTEQAFRTLMSAGVVAPPGKSAAEPAEAVCLPQEKP